MEGKSGIFIPSRFKRNYVEDIYFGYPYLTGSSIVQLDPLSGCRYLSRKYTGNAKELALHPSMIIITCSGRIGETVLINDYFKGTIGSPDLLRVVPDPEKVLPGYLYAFLSSKVGKALITQHTYGSVIQHIESHHLYNLPIPVLEPSLYDKIGMLINQAVDLRSSANFEIQNVVNEIDREWQQQKSIVKTFKVSSQEIGKGFGLTRELRLEAGFYNREATKISEWLETQKHGVIEDFSIDIRCSTIRARVFVESKFGIPLITGQWLNKTQFDTINFISRKHTRNIDIETIRRGETLISDAGTIGIVDFAYKNFYEGAFASQQIIRVIPDRTKIHPGYLFAFLKSKTGQIQMQRFKTGSVIQWIKEHHIGSIIIPIPPDRGEGLGERIVESYEKFQIAKKKEKQAIGLIEQELS